MPGLWVITGLVLANFLHLNRVATVLGALVTNTWISLATFLLSIKVGSAIMNLHWQEVYQKGPFLNLFLPIALGYLVIAVFFAFLSYIATFFLSTYLQKRGRIKKCPK
jgi:uncharacterized protein (DUF2062 family)